MGSFSKFYKGLQLLGKGSFARVVLCRDRTTNVEYATKVIHKKNLKSHCDSSIVHREVSLLKTLDHPNIMKINEYFEDESHFYLVGEVYWGGELFDEIVSRKHFAEADARMVIRQILSGICYIHQKNIVHRDLKPENILLEREGDISALRIVDFGLAAFFDRRLNLSDRTGTAYYIAPEVLKSKYTEKCDIWSIGIILYILLSGCPPFFGRDEDEILKKVELGKYTFKVQQFEKVSDSAKNIIRRMLFYVVEARPSAGELLRDPWFIAGEIRQPYEVKLKDFKCLYENFLAFRKCTRLTQTVMLYSASKLVSNEDARTCKEFFQVLDANGDGRLDRMELSTGYAELSATAGNGISSSQINRHLSEFFDLVDFDQDGLIDYSEFLTVALAKSFLLTDERTKRAFEIFDKSGDGHITESNLMSIFAECKGSSLEECRNMIGDCNPSRPGHLTFEDFIAAVRS